jgi:hypothetical protein
VAIELGAPADELPDPGRALADEHIYRRGVAQTDTSDQRVAGVSRWRVERIEDGGYAALSPPGGAVVDIHLRHHGHVQPGLAEV